VLRVADHYAGTDTGRQRRANEDSLLARAPLFVVADGMGGAQAGEVASRIAVESFQHGLKDASQPESALAALALSANSRIHELSHTDAEHAGMGTTLTAVYVGEQEVAIAHVGDSRAYCLRDGELLRLTDDHSLVDELLRQGRLTPEEAVEHPQRSVITRALGPEGTVEVDTRSFRARAGDVYLLCSDGLTTMLDEQQIAAQLRGHPRLRDAGEALIAAANEAGGRDNITVVLVRLEDVSGAASHPREGSRDDRQSTIVGAPAVTAPADGASGLQPSVTPRRPRPAPGTGSGPAPGSAAAAAVRRRRLRRAGALTIVLVVLGLIGSAGYLALQSVYFIGTNDRGLVTMFQGIPFRLPGNLSLYSSRYVSGVSAATLTRERRRTLLDHSLRSESDAAALIRSLELAQLE
jgi:serine/threonine protein phosphatase PrpC